MTSRFVDRRLLTLTAICAGWTAFVLALHLHVRMYQSVESAARDWLSTNPNARLSPLREDLAYLGIDTAALDALFDDELAQSPTLQLMKTGMPFNRAVYAAVLERLVKAGAKVVIFDLVFPGSRAGDAEFRAALDEYRDHVVIGSSIATKAEEAGETRGTISNKPVYVRPSASLIPPGPPEDPRAGFVNVRPDEDGLVRRISFRSSLLEFLDLSPDPQAEELLSFAARALEKAGRSECLPPGRDPVLIRFSAGFVPRSLHEIFVAEQWQRPPFHSGAFFKDKIVLVGAIGESSEDRLQTPHGTLIGPVIHLSAINAALNRDFLRETSLAANVALIAGAGALAWLLGASIRRPMLRFAVLLLALAAGYGAAQSLFNHTGWWPIVLSPFLALATSGFTWSVWEQVLDLLEKARLRRTFERYVSRDVVKELLDNPRGWLSTLGGSRKKITVLFSDVRGFTTLTESASDVQALFRQLNEYFDEMVNLVFANRGTLDKFIGDAVMAHWGSIQSVSEAEDARAAVRTAIQMRRTLTRLNPAWKARGLLELHFGIGVNHGEAVVGNLGCEAKMEVSVIGDAVNLASRLEGVTKTYHIDLCIGELVAPLVRDAFILRSLDLIVVKGKTRPVEIFAVIEERADGAPEPAWLAAHEEAMRLYRRGDFSSAAARWREVLAARPGDGISEVFLERCAALASQPADPAWKGVFEMKGK